MYADPYHYQVCIDIIDTCEEIRVMKCITLTALWGLAGKTGILQAPPQSMPDAALFLFVHITTRWDWLLRLALIICASTESTEMQ